MNVVTVLRSGGDFLPSHVQALQRQLRTHAPDARLVCLSDVPIIGVDTIRLKYDWPGWWAKLELFRPDLKGEFLFTDLDNVIVGAIDDFFTLGNFTMQRGGWTALMYIPDNDTRSQIWHDFVRHPEYHIARFRQDRVPAEPGVGNYGDAGFISSHIDAAQYWEDIVPRQIVNISAMLAPWPFKLSKAPEDARVILCHQPHRPWTMAAFRHLYEETE